MPIMKTRTLAALSAALLLPLAGLSCMDDPAAAASDPLMESAVSGIILPSYRNLDEAAADLVSACEDVEDDPDADTVIAAQTAWRRLRSVWKESEAFLWGPVKTEHLDTIIDFFPSDPAAIEAEISGVATISAAYLDSRGANKKGLPGIEYLLFDGTPVTALSGSARRRAWLLAAAESLKNETEKLLEAWEPGGGNFAGLVTAPGSGGSPYATPGEVRGELIGGLVFLAERIADQKLGRPLGNFTAGIPQPDSVESSYSDGGLDDIQSNLRGILYVLNAGYEGTSDLSLLGAVRAANPAAAGALESALVQAQLAVSLVPPPLEAAVISSDPVPAEAAFTAMKALKARLAVDLAGSLSATLGFNPNDGD